jgi:1,4-dihydroxy-2-naphthoate octaprenyltransferase
MAAHKTSLFKTVLSAARLRTLPLSVMVVLLGSLCAFHLGMFRWQISLGVLLTTLWLQILSNFANDYGDFVKGTDVNAGRNDRALASGALKLNQMKTLIIMSILMALFLGIGLLYVAFAGKNESEFWYMLALGIVAIIAAITYTVGKKAYGYYALGDLVVFLFFGPVVVIGQVFLHQPEMFSNTLYSQFILLFSASFCAGLPAVLVLNINNIRDIQKDLQNNKKTFAALLGLKKAKMYHLLLFMLLSVCFVLYKLNISSSVLQISGSLVGFIAIFFMRMYRILGANEQSPFQFFNHELKLLSLSALLIPILLWL